MEILSLPPTLSSPPPQILQDPVINIRLRLCLLFPTLKSLLKLPMDRLLLQNLELTVRKLISHERDPDASHSIRVAVIEMDRIEVAMETVSIRYTLPWKWWLL